MSKYQALIDALKAWPTSAFYTHPRDDNKWKENGAFAQACEPAVISSLLADLDAAVSLIEGVLMIDRGASGRIIIEGWQEETIRSALSQLKGD